MAATMSVSSEQTSSEYVTTVDLKSKAQAWLDALSYYAKRRPSFTLELSSSALLVMDMQNFFLDASSHAYIPAAQALVPNVRSLIELYRAHDRAIIFTRHAVAEGEDAGIMARWWRDTVREGTPHSEVIDALSPKGDEHVLRKTRYSAFYGTELERILRDGDVSSIVLTGVMTDLCCESTARDAFLRDFEVYLVIDGMATLNEELHMSSLRTLVHGFGVPMLSGEILGLGGEGVGANISKL